VWHDYNHKAEFRIYNSTGTRHVAEDMKVHSQQQDQGRTVTSSDGVNQTLEVLASQVNKARSCLSRTLLDSQLCIPAAKRGQFSIARVMRHKAELASELFFMKTFGKFCVASSFKSWVWALSLGI
jgi:hypothetical protein